MFLICLLNGLVGYTFSTVWVFNLVQQNRNLIFMSQSIHRIEDDATRLSKKNNLGNQFLKKDEI